NKTDDRSDDESTSTSVVVCKPTPRASSMSVSLMDFVTANLRNIDITLHFLRNWPSTE
ncbi:hypothetical protein KIN20_030157, partial [Parelaphostrongylus tenuis]